MTVIPSFQSLQLNNATQSDTFGIPNPLTAMTFNRASAAANLTLEVTTIPEGIVGGRQAGDWIATALTVAITPGASVMLTPSQLADNISSFAGLNDCMRWTSDAAVTMNIDVVSIARYG